MPTMLQARQERIKELAPRLKTMAMLVKENPEDPEMWAGLGAAFMDAEQYPAAVNAFKQAVLYSGGHPEWIIRLVKAQIMEANGVVTQDAKQGLQIVLTLQPDNAEAQRLLNAP